MLITSMLLIFSVLFSTGVNSDLLRQKELNASGWPMESTPGEKNSLEDAIGLITLNKKIYSRASRLQFFNEDGSLWYEFSFYEDDADQNLNRSKVDFQPFSFHPDYFVLALKCVSEDSNRFQVVVNETTGLKKFIRRYDAVFVFQTWQQHILDLFAVGVDRSNNPLRMSPTDSVQSIRVPSTDMTFHPVRIDGNWLKVSWNVSDERKNKRVGYGWVKWKHNHKLLVEFFYFS
jgi:hypothetical protein